MKKDAETQSDLKVRQVHTKTSKDLLETHYQELYRTLSLLLPRR